MCEEKQQALITQKLWINCLSTMGIGRIFVGGLGKLIVPEVAKKIFQGGQSGEIACYPLQTKKIVLFSWKFSREMSNFQRALTPGATLPPPSDARAFHCNGPSDWYRSWPQTILRTIILKYINFYCTALLPIIFFILNLSSRFSHLRDC